MGLAIRNSLDCFRVKGMIYFVQKKRSLLIRKWPFCVIPKFIYYGFHQSFVLVLSASGPPPKSSTPDLYPPALTVISEGGKIKRLTLPASVDACGFALLILGYNLGNPVRRNSAHASHSFPGIRKAISAYRFVPFVPLL